LAVLLVTAGLVSVGLLVSGASGPNGAQTDRAQPNATAADERLQALDEFVATREGVVDRGDDTTRTVERATVAREGDLLRIHVRADGFLWELVRRLVSLVHAVATGDRDLDAVSRALDPGTLPDHERVGPAPPGPLVLRNVGYPDVAVERDPAAAASARAGFASANETAVARAATTALLRDGVADPEPGSGL
jgi:tRNA pseudouridine38-40 synthase